MIIYPAIDVKDGKCVRLKQGKADDTTIFFENPADAAKMWVDKGTQTLHIVDLDGAFNGSPRNLEVITKIKKETGVFIQMGGGIRDKDTIRTVLDNNIDRVILGTAALDKKDLVEWSVKQYGERIAVSIDALNKKVAYHGWTGISDISIYDLMESLISLGVRTFIYTDISKDGMMKGPDHNGIKEINNRFNVNIIASGGVTTMDDVKTLKDAGVYGAIIGRALYDGSIAIEQAMEVAACC